MFILGCNYWASHAGCEMWAQWDETVVENDLKRCSENGLTYLRVFPNWRDFQPVCGYYGVGNSFREYRDPKGRKFTNPYYLDEDMMCHFDTFCRIAQKHGIKLIVGLITGWMSGRMFAPPILHGENVMRNAVALDLQQRFVKGFVSRFCDMEAIYAWDLGNECNCMSLSVSRAEASVWSGLIANTIRAFDKHKRPVISGMHSLKTDGVWSISDQAEHTDVLTTHPYPQFVPHCFKDDMLSFRTLLHATCEGSFYSDLGGKPCLTEEIGTLGPNTCDDETSAAFLKTNLYSNWAHGMTGLLWWCANEQVELETPPYSWNMMERELGAFNVDGTPKPIVREFRAFSQFLDDFGGELSAPMSDGVCIVTGGQDQWGVAYMSFLLAKQAGVNLTFVSHNMPLPDSEVYLLPSYNGAEHICKEQFDILKEKVRAGATLYLSNNNGNIAKFEELTGVHIKNSCYSGSASVMNLNGTEMAIEKPVTRQIESPFAIASDKYGQPVMTKYAFGKGTVYYLDFPVENMLLAKGQCQNGGHHVIYKEIFGEQLNKHIAHKSNTNVGLTLHTSGEDFIAVLVNYSNKSQVTGFSVNDGYAVEKIYHGNPDELQANDAAVVRISKKK